MLVIGRKPKQKVIMLLNGEKVTEITVVEVHGSTVKLGFVAPSQMKIWRDEVCPENGKPAK